MKAISSSGKLKTTYHNGSYCNVVSNTESFKDLCLDPYWLYLIMLPLGYDYGYDLF